MTEQNAVIQAVYADFKLIKTRSCLQLVFEVPVERATEALAIFGVPNHLTDVHVAIARLQAPAKEVMPNPADSVSDDKALPHSSGGGAPIYHGPPRLRDESRETRPETEEPIRKVDTTKSERAKASYRMSDDGEKAVTRAAILCVDAKFAEWLGARHGWRIGGAGDGDFVARLLRGELGITSRKEIASDERAYAAFLALEAEYRLATGQMAEIR